MNHEGRIARLEECYIENAENIKWIRDKLDVVLATHNQEAGRNAVFGSVKMVVIGLIISGGTVLMGRLF